MTMKAFLSSTYSKMIFVGGMNIILQERLLSLLILLLDVDHEDGPHIWLGDFLRVDLNRKKTWLNMIKMYLLNWISSVKLNYPLRSKQLQIEDFAKINNLYILNIQESNIDDDSFKECKSIAANYTIMRIILMVHPALWK